METKPPELWFRRVLSDPAWLRDPIKRALQEAHAAIEEILRSRRPR
jgi:hypothetical protein